MIKELERLIPHRELLSQQMGLRWFALTGDRIELEATGVIILMTNDPKQLPFVLIDPVGRELAYATDLAILKAAGEHHAKQLEAFKP
jgi:hypothetical protein